MDHHIAKRFAHLAALLIEHKAVGEHVLVGRMAGHGDGGEQAALEPAAVLVGALEVEVGREVEGGVAAGTRLRAISRPGLPAVNAG